MGATQATALAMIKCRFAGREEVLERTFAASESFRDLCRDYLACAATLARWQESAGEGAPLRVQEYSELLDDLTTEIEVRLCAEGR